MWRGKEPPSCPSDSNLLYFAAVHKAPRNIPLFPVYLRGKTKRISGPWSCIASLRLPRAAKRYESPLLPTPPLFSFPSPNALFNSQTSLLHCNPIKHQDPESRIQDPVLNEFYSTLEKKKKKQRQLCTGRLGWTPPFGGTKHLAAMLQYLTCML